jgi:hypothetical protein
VGVARIALVLAVAAGVAHAEVDWAAGLVTAKGLGIADRHAPSPAAAREPARRRAEASAREALAKELAALPLAGKTKLSDPAVKPRLERALAAAITVDSTLHTDGSWNVTLAVPIEAVRQAIAGPRVANDADKDPPVIVVEGVKGKPAVGVTVGGIAAAAIWVTEVPAWAKDAPRVKAKATKPGAIELAGKHGGPATLFVLVR